MLDFGLNSFVLAGDHLITVYLKDQPQALYKREEFSKKKKESATFWYKVEDYDPSIKI